MSHDPNRCIHVAVLKQKSERMGLWKELFFEARVPVTDATPTPTILPGYDHVMSCFFVDFSVGGRTMWDRINAANERRKEAGHIQNGDTIAAMLRGNIYPVICNEDITVVTAPWRLWYGKTD